MEFQPLGDRIIVKVEQTSESCTDSGIYLYAADKKLVVAEVIAIGTGRIFGDGKVIEPAVKVGDKVVLINQEARFKYDPSDQSLELISEDEILGLWQK